MALRASRQDVLSAWATALAQKGAGLEVDEASVFLEGVVPSQNGAVGSLSVGSPADALLPLATFIRSSTCEGEEYKPQEEIISLAKQLLLESWESLATRKKEINHWGLSTPDVTKLLELLSSLMQEHVFDGVEQAAVSAILRDILCDAVSQPVAVASSSDLVAISGHAAMQNAMMQCSISCVGSRSDPQQLPLISPDTKAVLQTASSVLRELSGGKSRTSRNRVHEETIMTLVEKLLLTVSCMGGGGVGEDWEPLLQELLAFSQSHISNALQSLAWAMDESHGGSHAPGGGQRSDPTGASAALAVPTAACAGALLCQQSGSEAVQQEVTDVIMALTSLAEGCMRAAWPLGMNNQTSAHLLGLAKMVVIQVKVIVAAFLAAGGPVACVPFSRLRGLVVSGAQLMQAAEVPAHEWDWDIEAKCLAASYEGIYPATGICRAAVQALVDVMNVCWRYGHETTVKSLLLPGLESKRPIGPESIPLIMMVGRLCMAVQGEEKLSRIVLPLLIDRLLSTKEALPAALLARLLHTLGKIAGAAAHNSDRWAFDQVIALLVKLYKEPSTITSQHLMHNGRALSGGDDGPELPGSLADVLTCLGKSLAGAPPAFPEALQYQLLLLFCDFGLKMVPSKSSGARGGASKQRLTSAVAADLAELLPAIAAACEHAPAYHPANALDPNMTFDRLALELKADETRIQMCRIMWLYSALLALTPVPVSYKWDGASEKILSRRSVWREALGHIAIHTAPLLVESGRREQEMLVDIRTRLRKLGSAGEAGVILHGLTAVWRMPGVGHPPSTALPTTIASTARNAYLLTVAGMELTRASTSLLDHTSSGSHTAALLQHLHGKAASDFEFLKALTGAVFDCYLTRMRHTGSLTHHAPRVHAADVKVGREALAGVLVANLQVPNGSAEVSRVAEGLLDRLLTACPALLWSRDVVCKLVAMPQLPEAEDPVSRTIGRWVSASMKWAPMAAEAVLHEELRASCMPDAHIGSGTAATRLLSGFYAPKAHKYPTGLQALGQKLHYSGVISGLKISIDMSAGASSSCELAVDMLQRAASGEGPSRQLKECYLQAVALLVEDGPQLDRAEYFQLLRMLAWVPDKFMDPETVSVVNFGLTWISVGAPEVTAAMLGEVTNMWISSSNRKVGLFSGGSILSSQAPPEELLQSIEAQQLLLNFLEEHWVIAAHGAVEAGEAVLTVFRRFLELSLQDPSRMLLHPCCTTAYFRLLTLGLRYCRRMGAAGMKGGVGLQIPLLFGRILLAALHWFTSSPTFYQHSDTTVNLSSAQAVLTFAAILEAINPLPTANGINPEGLSRLPSGLQAADAQREQVELLKLLLGHEIERLKVWAAPLETTSGTVASKAGTAPAGGTKVMGASAAAWIKFTSTAWEVDPQLALALTERFPAVPEVEARCATLVVKHAHVPAVQVLPAAAKLLARHCVPAPELRHLLEHLSTWACSDLVTALFLLTGSEADNIETRSYALRSLYACDPEDVAFYLPQLVQGLRNDKAGDLKEYLKAAASRSYIFCHRLVWNLQSEEKPPPEAIDPEVKRSGWEPPKDTGLWDLVDKVKAEVLEGLSQHDLEYLQREFAFFDDVTKISGSLAKYEKAERPFRIGEYLQQVKMRGDDLYLPTNVDSRVVRLIPESGTPMQSAAKVPILVAFEVEPMDDTKDVLPASRRYNQACIFKVGDDCRQDVMSLQVIDLLKQRFISVGLDLYLVPYGVLPTGYECGIIEVVPNSASRASLGETSESGLFDIFQREFGAPGSVRFEDARTAFIKSSAGYAVASFLLQAKDRHNGNILLDTKGHLVHIDFGFVLEISPGNNMRFESAAFKLSHEMCQLLDPGGHRTSPSFKIFEELCVKGYLAARTNVDAIMAAVSLMVESGLPCFGHGEPLKNLYARFHMDLSDKQAAEFMRSTIADAYDKWTTRFYDVIQWYQQGIEK